MIKIFEVHGYSRCVHGAWESGYASRQLASGRWAGKLGDQDDIEHTELSDLKSKIYGDPVQVMRRRM